MPRTHSQKAPIECSHGDAVRNISVSIVKIELPPPREVFDNPTTVAREPRGALESTDLARVELTVPPSRPRPSRPAERTLAVGSMTHSPTGRVAFHGGSDSLHRGQEDAEAGEQPGKRGIARGFRLAGDASAATSPVRLRAAVPAASPSAICPPRMTTEVGGTMSTPPPGMTRRASGVRLYRRGWTAAGDGAWDARRARLPSCRSPAP